ncbi:MAG TPA: dienelactone hydrolase family protein [Thermoanaerobaculia bacterium]
MNDTLALRYIANVPTRRAESESMPMVILIHGRGADARDLADLAPILDTPSGCRFILPNAPKPFEAYPGMTFGWTWFDGWPPIHESVVESREILLRFVDQVTERYPTPEGKLVIAGFSQGALMAFEAGLRTAKPAAGIVAMSGGLYEADLPELSSRQGTPVLIAHGSDDEVVPANYGRRARRLLEDAGLEVEYHEFPMAHQVVPEEIDVVKAFLARVLAPEVTA